MEKKVCVVVNSRANYGRIRSVLAAISRHPRLELQLVVGASALLYRFGRVVDVIEQDGYKPDALLYSIVEGENPVTMAKSTGLAITELATIFQNLAPNVVLTVADRFETLATAVAASYMNIGLAHTQGGESTGSIDESVRHAITKLAHIHFPSTKKSAENVVRMGERADMVFNVGCPSIDEISGVLSDSKSATLPDSSGVGDEIDLRNPYLVVLQHPVTTEYGRGFEQIKETALAIRDLQMPAVWLWPNADAGSDDLAKGIRTFREQEEGMPPIRFFRNLEIETYARLIKECSCLIGNSSSAIREGAYLGTPAVDIGTRQNRRETAQNVIHVGHNSEEICQAVEVQLTHGKYPNSNLYGDGRAGEKIADVLASTDITIQKYLEFGK